MDLLTKSYASTADDGATSFMAVQAHTVVTVTVACEYAVLDIAVLFSFEHVSPQRQASVPSFFTPNLGVNSLHQERSLATSSNLMMSKFIMLVSHSQTSLK